MQAATHWDALAHAGYEHELYNGTPDTVVTDVGAARLGIDSVGPVVSRGVLADVARALGVERFDDAHPISGDDLEAALALGGLTAEPGDILLVRTGQMAWLREGDKDRFAYPRRACRRRQSSGSATTTSLRSPPTRFPSSASPARMRM